MFNFVKGKSCLSAIIVLLYSIVANGQSSMSIDSVLPVRGLCISAPSHNNIDSFVTFINKELGPNKINLLILRVDYRYQYKSHPELVDSGALSNVDVKKLVNACRQNKIRLVPQINLLGHQSWANKTEKLLTVYPQFDETPWVKMPEKYEWPNPDGLYCKSYCPNHPDVHKVVFALVDELCDVFETDGFHAGMDEVFYIGDDRCPRCKGLDKAELFANEVRKIHDHLATKNRELFIWGDRLLDGKTTGLGMWEASMNNTHRAVDMIPKSVIICDWHYNRPDKTAIYFAMKGLRVVTSPWRKPDIALKQVDDMIAFRRDATPEMKAKLLGIVETVWSPVTPFFNGYYSKQATKPNPTPKDVENEANQPWHVLRALFGRYAVLSKP